MDRATFTATHLSWSRQVGDVRVTHCPSSLASGAYEYLVLRRICSREAALEVINQMSSLAMESNAYLTAVIERDYVQVQIAVSCDADPVVEVAAEATEKVEVVE